MPFFAIAVTLQIVDLRVPDDALGLGSESPPQRGRGQGNA
jgi:hypothetical protein